MDVKIKETGEIKTLEIRDERGIEWADDMIGNAGAKTDGQFTWDDEEEVYLAEQGTYDWWHDYIADYEATEEAITALAEKLDVQRWEIVKRVGEAQDGVDYDRHHEVAMQALEEYEAEYNAEDEDDA
jgi:hypothetical protein